MWKQKNTMISYVKEASPSTKERKSEGRQNKLVISLRDSNYDFLDSKSVSLFSFYFVEFKEQLKINIKNNSERIESVSLIQDQSSYLPFDENQIISPVLTLTNLKKLYLRLEGFYSSKRGFLQLMRYPQLQKVQIFCNSSTEFDLLSEIGPYLKNLKHLKHLSIQLQDGTIKKDTECKEFIYGLQSCVNLEKLKLKDLSSFSKQIYLIPELFECLETLQQLKSVKFSFNIDKFKAVHYGHALSQLIRLPLLEKLQFILCLQPKFDSQIIVLHHAQDEEWKLKDVSKNLKELTLKLYWSYTINSQIPFIGDIVNLQILTLHICNWHADTQSVNKFYSSISKLEQLIEVNLLFSELRTKENGECSYLLGQTFSKMKKLKKMQLFHQLQPANLFELQVFLINFGRGISPIKNLISLKLAISCNDLSQYQDCLYNFRKILRLSAIILR